MFSRSCDFPPRMGCCRVRYVLLFFFCQGGTPHTVVFLDLTVVPIIADTPGGPSTNPIRPVCPNRPVRVTRTQSMVLWPFLRRSVFLQFSGFSSESRDVWLFTFARRRTACQSTIVPDLKRFANSNDNVLGTWKTILYWVCWVPIVFYNIVRLKFLYNADNNC